MSNPREGIKLKDMVQEMVSEYGWEYLAYYFTMNCFEYEPSIKSTLKFLRKTPWAKKKIEDFYFEWKNI